MRQFPAEDREIVTICGSMRFAKQMLVKAEMMTAEGIIVLMPFVTKKHGDVSGVMLDTMHRDKIDMSDYIVVVYDATMYIGESTRNEIQYAKTKGLSVLYEIILSN